MSDAIVGIDVSKKTLDAYCARGQMHRGRTFANSPDGWKLVGTWLKATLGLTVPQVLLAQADEVIK